MDVERTVNEITGKIKYYDFEIAFNPKNLEEEFDVLISCMIASSNNIVEFINKYEFSGCSGCKYGKKCLAIAYSWFFGLMLIRSLVGTGMFNIDPEN